MVSRGIQTICYYDHWVQIAFDSRRRTHSSTSYDFSNWLKKRNVQREFSDIAAANALHFFSNERPPEDDIITSPTKMERLFLSWQEGKNSSKGGKAANAARKTITWSSYHGNLRQSVSLFFYCWRKLRRPAPSQLLGFVLVPLMFRSVPSLVQKSFWKCNTLLEKFILGKICNFFRESIHKFTSFPFWHWMTQLIHGALAVVPSSDVVCLDF